MAKAAAFLVSIVLALLFAAPAVAPASGAAVNAVLALGLNRASVAPDVVLLDASFSPNAAVGGVPFCSSGSLGTILCYPPSFLKTAYDFPRATEHGAHDEPSSLDGRGSTIVIVDAFGSPTIQSDLNTFDAAFGLPPATISILCGPTWSGKTSDHCPVTTIADLTTAPNADICGAVGWAEETTLDVTMAHALAPGAKIVLVAANDCYDTSLYGAEQAVVSQHRYWGSIMSQSFGEPDDLVTCTALDPTGTYCVSYDPTLLNLPNSVFWQATKAHWTIIASSGDDGANEAARYTGTGELIPSFPSTNPLVLSAGGTQGNPYGGQYGFAPGPGGTFSCAPYTMCNTGLVVINGGPNGCGTAARPGEPSSCVPVRYGGEGAWNEWDYFGLATSTGGGISSLYPRPYYQWRLPKTVTTTLGVKVPVTGREVPDVSFNSAIYGGVLAYLGFFGLWAVFGGTSASSPAWAGIIALLNQANGRPVGFINPEIYGLNHWTIARSFHDITVGNNSDTGTQFGLDGYNAGRGYDLTTGWGTPDVAHFIQAMVSD